MTCQDLFMKLTLPLMGERSETAASYREQALPVINIITADCFNINNSLREALNKPVLLEIPYFTTFDDEIPYEPEILINVMPYGVGARLVIDDGEADKLGFLEANYADRYNQYKHTAYVDYEDHYQTAGGGC